MTEPSAKPCAVCGRPIEPRWRPFCSRRCADVDLFRWLNGSYRIPAAPREADDEAESAGVGDDNES